MANKAYGYQYETSPRKLEPDYKKVPVKKKKSVPQKPAQKQGKKKPVKKAKHKKKLSFEVKFFINSMLFFSLIFAVIACQTLVKQKYKEKENLKKEYNELLARSNTDYGFEEDVRILASQYGMQTKSATLIDLGTSDYIESSADEVQQETRFWEKMLDWLKEKFK